jgi:hypothetical protein
MISPLTRPRVLRAGPRIDDPRDIREFIDAKRIKREPIFVRASARGAGTWHPSNIQSFRVHLAGLRGAGDWGRAVERVDALDSALFRRHASHLPLPNSVIQNADSSLTLAWDGALVRAFPDALVVLIGGLPHAKQVTTVLLDALGMLAKMRKQ